MLLDTPICHFGWRAPDFSLENVDGQRFGMADCMGDNGLLIAFICNHCPYVKAIADDLAADAETLMSRGVGVVAIMSNDYRKVVADSPEQMKLFASRHNFSFPYLVDHDQTVAKAYEAVCTPDFFGLNANGELHYRGRFDNLGAVSRSADISTRQAELLDAMTLIAETGHGPTQQTASMGCSIKWA